jgi:phosphatidylserine decarboxylase
MDANQDGKLTADECEAFMRTDHPVVKQVYPATKQLIWKAYLRLQDGVSVAELVLNSQNVTVEAAINLESDSSENKKLAKEILVQNRETGKLEIELIPSYIRLSMKLMYSTKVGSATVGKVKGILNKMTVRQGKTYDAPSSRNEIESFIAFHHLNVQEMLDEDLKNYKNFNEFFYRKLKPSARPIFAPNDDHSLISPADCRLNVFPTVTEAQEFWIKGNGFSLKTLLDNDELATEYNDCSLVIARLAPQDYHRYHSPASGKIGDFRVVDGTYFTVDPIAINQSIDVYGQNKRLITSIETEHFGKILFIAVGATMVGSINMTVQPGQVVRKGDELGYFAFGGSTTLLLIKPQKVQFDHDLLVNSSKQIETLVKVNTSLGRAVA